MHDVLTEPEFHRRILATAAWCIPQLEAGWQLGLLRSPKFLTGEFNGQLAEWQVDEVVKHRSGHCARMSVDSILNHSEFLESRLIGCDCRNQSWYEVANNESWAFFDRFDFPPWDTWLAMFGIPDFECPDWLISWVPRCCLSHVRWGLMVAVSGRSWITAEDNLPGCLLPCQEIFAVHLPHFVTNWTPAVTIEKVRAGEVWF